MKKAWMVALLVLGVASAVALAADVMSVNIVGFNKVTIPANGGVNLVAIQFDGMESQTFEGVFGPPTNQFVKAIEWEDYDTADRIYKWTGTGYITYSLHWNGSWVRSSQWVQGTPTNPPLKSGEAVWLQSGKSTPQHDVAIMGQVVSVATQQVNMATGFQTIGYPFSSTTKIKDLDFVRDGATRAGEWEDFDNGDVIYVWTGSGYATYGLHFNGSWVKSSQWLSGTPTTNVLELGNGFWYNAKNAFAYTETNRYLNVFNN